MFIDYFVTVHLTVLGIFKNRKYENYEKYLSAFMIATDIVIFISFIIAFPQADTFVHQCSIITTMLGAFVFCLHRSIAISRKKQLLRIIRTLRSDPPFYSENQVKINTATQLSENFYPMIQKMFCFLAITGIMPYTNFLYNDNIDYNEPDLYVIPFLYHFWDVHSFKGFALIQLFQCITIGHFAFIYFSFIGLINYMICNINAHITELNSQIDNSINGCVVHWDLSNNSDTFKNKVLVKQATEKVFVDRFIYLIRYQLYIQRYIKDFSNFLDTILSYYVFQFVLLAFGFTVLGAKMLENNAGTFLQNLSPIIMFLYGFYTWCYVCEAVGHTNELLLRSLYTTKWYTFPLKIRKLMLLTMIHTQRKRNIRAFGIVIINFGLGLQVLKAIYSVVNFLMVKRKNVL